MIRHKADSKHPEPIYKVHRAIKKYGIENFEITVLEECTQEMLDEKKFIGFLILIPSTMATI